MRWTRAAQARADLPSPFVRKGRRAEEGREATKNRTARIGPLARRACTALIALTLASPLAVEAEYADVVLNQRSEHEGMRPVVFPHWFHRIRFRCKVCHSELGFKMRAGANQVLMNDIVEGRFCGMCHNNQIAWGPERCELCHSGLPGLLPGIVGGAQTSGPGRW